MRRRTRWIVRTAAVLLGLPILLAVLVLIAANTEPGRELIEWGVPKFTGGEVTITGLAGRFPDSLRAGRIEVRDHAGPWLVMDDLRLDWSPSRLLAGVAQIDRLEAGQIAVDRLPAPSAPRTGRRSLPIGVALRALRVNRLVLAAPVAGTAAALAIDGTAHLAALGQGDVDLSVRRLDGEGNYRLRGRVDPAALRAHLTAQEPAHGLISGIARLPELGALSVDASLDGPRSAVHTKVALEAGPLHAAAQGTLDLEHRAADLTLTASAPAMRPRPDLSWQAVALDVQLHGPFTKPTANGTLQIDALDVAGAAIRRIAAKLQGDTGRVGLHAEVDGLRAPGPQPDLLRGAPLKLQADARLDAPHRPVTFTVKHPLIDVEGKAETAGEIHGEAALTLPDLAPFAAAGGVDVQGNTTLIARAALRGDTTRLEVDGKLGVTGGTAPLPALVGGAAKFGIAVSIARHGQDIALSRLQLDGRTLTLSASGGVTSRVADLKWKVALSDLAAVTPKVSGRFSAQGHIAGPQDDLAVTAVANGEVATKGMPRGPITLKLRARGLPGAPSGELTAQGVLDGSPLELALAAQRSADSVLHVAIRRADWKSAHAEGALTLPKGADLPVGKVDLRLTRLEDLRRLVGRPLSGSVTAALKMTAQNGRQQVHLDLDARNAALDGTASVGHVTLAATVVDPTTHPVTDGRLTLDAISAGGIIGSARLEVAGPGEALHLRLSAAAQNLAGAEARLTSAATLDAPAKNVAVSALQASWKGETLRLLSPVRVGFGAGITLDRLRLGLRKAVLEVAGRAAPTLDLSVALRNVPADLAALFAPGLAADGTLRADARLTGTPARLDGTVKVEAKGLRVGPGRTLPPADLIATAHLSGESAQIDSRLTADSTRLTLTGQTSLNRSGPIALHAEGSAKLAMLDPFLAAGGRRVRGQMTLNADIAGSLSAPRVTGTVQVADGEVQDFAQGAHITHLTALLQVDGDTIRITRLEGRAGPGTITASGTIGVLAPGMPVDLSITARNARPLASDRLTVKLDADLTLRGEAARRLTAAGTLRIHRAEIAIPEHLPTSIAVLNVRTPGAPPPPPATPGPRIALNLTIKAAREIFVRGRGLDTELGGTVRVHGTTANPQPDGSFEMLRGEFRLVGQTLTFSKGVVSFNGGSLTDPSLNFVASATSGNVTATLTVSGTAQKPKITLSSVPDLPQDEVLAHLLFGRGISSLGPLELAQIAAAAASLTGVTSGIGNPLESIRKSLGLSRLSVSGGSGRTGTQATVQIDLAKGLKLESTVGTGSSSGATNSGGSSVGLIYEFEY